MNTYVREPFHCLGTASDLIKFNRKVCTDFRGPLSLAHPGC